MIEGSVHRIWLSIFLMQIIIPFRLIEHQFGPIVNAIETAPGFRPTWKENEMSILSSIGRIATEFSAARTRYRTERAIRALPPELQKDIGWPEAADIAAGARKGVGTWAGAK
jgi:hypothetical protein